MNDAKIQEIYKSMNNKTRESVDKLPLRDRYELLHRKLKTQESRAIEKSKEPPMLTLKLPSSNKIDNTISQNNLQKQFEEKK